MSGGTPPVSGTKYEWSTDGSVANAIGTQKNIRIISIAASCTWTVQPNPLEIHVTVDGVSHVFIKSNPVSATDYVGVMRHHLAENDQSLYAADDAIQRSFLLEGKSVKVEAEITGGTVSALNMRVKWAKIP